MCVLILTGLLVTLVLLSCPCFCFNLFLSSSSELKTQPCASLVCNVWRVLEPAGSHCTIVAGEPFVFLLTHLKKRKVLFSAHFFFPRQCHQFPKQQHPSPKWEVSADSSPRGPAPERNVAAPCGLLGAEGHGAGGVFLTRSRLGKGTM